MIPGLAYRKKALSCPYDSKINGDDVEEMQAILAVIPKIQEVIRLLGGTAAEPASGAIGKLDCLTDFIAREGEHFSVQDMETLLTALGAMSCLKQAERLLIGDSIDHTEGVLADVERLFTLVERFCPGYERKADIHTENMNDWIWEVMEDERMSIQQKAERVMRKRG